MSYEPKYKLNRADEERLRELIYRECCGAAGSAVAPLTLAEAKELKALSHKQDQKIWSHPKMAPVKKAQRNHNRRCKRLSDLLHRLLSNRSL